MSERAETTRVREGVGLFDGRARGLLAVKGSDRVRWLDGMLTADVKAIEKRGEGAGRPALLLTHRGAIVGEFHVGRIGEALLLDCARAAIPRIREALEKRIIADDVVLDDRSEAYGAIGLEGARAQDVLERAGDGAAAPPPEDWASLRIAGVDVLVAGFGWSGERAFLLRVPPGAEALVREALLGAATGLGVDGVVGDEALLETLRIEAGVPLLGAELDEEVLPPEARLERAIAINKGCYVGQEIVARLRSRGQVNHLLVGLRFGSGALPAPGAALMAAGKAIGEVTSRIVSPTEGAIGLGYVRRELAEPGTVLDVEGAPATVAVLPFVAPITPSAAAAESSPPPSIPPKPPPPKSRDGAHRE